ncbi:Uma2 family endonuclease [Sphingomonas psychrotolerans]|uniref:Uma2 family endonuclease n=1 Tax=Sphingomonas psychrotolerans TaxID=1327635 RepID=A0ABU3MZA2_9SPHN|nr:Uma2 family endonuclease [Sphingomonas psychrotolerans]MDT8757356.1 Uma2 family endonuclease [Sphingomonas psychrotolerans]
MATQTEYPLLTAREFLEIEFGEHKAELDNGVIRMMAGGTARHARVQFNLILALGSRLRGTGCTPYGPDMGVETHDRSIRYPGVTVYCGRDDVEDDEAKAFNDPRVIFEVLSAGTARTDLRVKLPEYTALPSVETIAFVDMSANGSASSSVPGPADGASRPTTSPSTSRSLHWV